MKDYNLSRFIEAQKKSYAKALTEIKFGRKRTHWIWYIFPTLSLGQSEISKYYAISDLEEAKAYIKEPFLRENLITITKALLSLDESDPEKVMGYPDDLKLCSSMTLFEIADPSVSEFGLVLEKYYNGKRDEKTIALLAK